MAKLTDIKYKIDQLDGGSFQALCDAYLSKVGYNNIVTLGTKSGTQKTTKGIPDTYFTEKNGKYILVMYTTQKKKLFDKIKKDLEDAMNKKKTRLELEDITEIIFCHTSSNINAGQDKELKKICKDNGILLTLIGIDHLAQELYSKYHQLANDFLSIPLDTGQILDKEGFVSSYNLNKLATPIDTEFHFREKELSQVIELITNNSIVIISGQAGVGKTRLALECVEQYNKSFNGRLYYIRSNGLSIYDDLKDFLNEPTKYLIFIDDANQLTNLNLLIEYVNKPGYKIKIICTVRDYARQAVIGKIKEYKNPVVINLSNFSDNEIEELMKDSFGIKNNKYLDQIVRIAEGNARIGMLAGKLALTENNLEAIADISQLYENYYGKYLEDNSILKIDTQLCATAGIVAFLERIHLDYLDAIAPILNYCDLSSGKFKKYIYQLHDLEILDICNDKAVKFSEQCLSNYLIKYVFVDRKIIPLELMIEKCFSFGKERIINAINILGRIFNSDETNEKIFGSLTKIWNKFKKENKTEFFDFVKIFHRINSVETLILLEEKINEQEQKNFNYNSMNFEEEKRNERVNDDILNILGDYSDTTLLPEALDLFFIYLKKRPDRYTDFYHAANRYFNISKNSSGYNYYTQVNFLKKLYEYSEEWKNSIINQFFIDISKKMIKLVHNSTENWRNNSVRWHTIPVIFIDGSQEYRKLIWNGLLELMKISEYKTKVMDILEEYTSGKPDTINQEIINYDWTHIVGIIDNNYNENDILDCISANKIKERFDWFKFIDTSILNKFFIYKKFKLYKLLIGRNKLYESDWKRGEELKKEEILKYILDKDLSDIKEIIDLCNEIKFDQSEEYELSESLIEIFKSIKHKKDLFINMVSYYLEKNTPLNIYPNLLVQELFKKLEVGDVYNLINSWEYRAKTDWEFAFYSNIPAEKIEEKHISGWYDYLYKKLSFKIPYYKRKLDFLSRYFKFDKQIFLESCKIILAQIPENNLLVNVYFSNFFNSSYMKPDELIKTFENDKDLLIVIYLRTLEQEKNIDYNGIFFSVISKLDPDFIIKYLSLIMNNKFRNGEYVKKHLKTLWGHNDYMIKVDLAAEYIYKNSEKVYFLHAFNEFKLLLFNDSDENISNKQDNWIKYYIEKFNFDKSRMEYLFRAILGSGYSNERRKKHILYFIEINQSFEIFEAIPLVTSSFGGIESVIPELEGKIIFLETLIPHLSGLKYLEHKQLINNEILNCKKTIESTQIREMLEH